MEDLNSKRLKRFAGRVGDLRYNYDTTITSSTYDGSSTTYQLVYDGLESMSEPITVTLDIVDGKLNVGNTTIA